MYSLVNTNDFEYADYEMDDRDSVYFDTISVSGSEPNRKSLSLSRQTIYHSAVDLPVFDTITTPRKDYYYNDYNTANNPSGDYRKNNITDRKFSRQSTLLDVGDYTDNVPLGFDEVSARLIDNSNQVKKLPITYSQWKSRVK